jgi:ATP-dependent Clp protease ATP-binding subunit ClpX
VESCIERLLIEANYDVKATEHGIVVLDEFDKLARRETTTGRDVSGEGVQQALLKLVEGTKVTINVKDNRSSSSRATTPIPTNYNASGAPTTTLPVNSPPGKVDQYTIDTTNILFVFCGAFVGLDKLILQRVTRPAMGFGGDVQSRHTGPGNSHILPPETYSHLAHYSPQSASSFTPIDLVTSEDLQRFGFIPEIIGRLHNICALSPLSKEDLNRILTEPRNSLVAQYTALFETYPSQLYFTEKALTAIAERALAAATGARGLKMEMERVLAEAMFDAPTPYVLITEACVKGFEKAAYWGKDGRHELSQRLEEEQLDSHNPQHPPEQLGQADEGRG